MDYTAGLEEGQILRMASLKPGVLAPCGLWSEFETPPVLRGGLIKRLRYLQAVSRINRVIRHLGWIHYTILNAGTFVFGLFTCLTLAILPRLFCELFHRFIFALIGFILSLSMRILFGKRVLYCLKMGVNWANEAVWVEDVLIGCMSKKELLVVRVPLSACREHLGSQFDAALMKHSCEYVCCLADWLADSALPLEGPGHMRGAPCFCQFVLKQEWSLMTWLFRGSYSSSGLLDKDLQIVARELQ